MYYKCNSKCNGMSALICFSDTFYLIVPKHFFISLISPPGYKPPIYKPTQNPFWNYKPRALKWDFTVCFFISKYAFLWTICVINSWIFQEVWLKYLSGILKLTFQGLRVQNFNVNPLTPQMPKLPSTTEILILEGLQLDTLIYTLLVKLHWWLSKMARADWSRTS